MYHSNLNRGRKTTIEKIMGWLRRDSAERGRVRNGRRPSLQLESLETRALMAAGVTANLLDGVLVVEGTESRDLIVISSNNNHLSVNGIAETFDSSGVQKIEVRAGGGSDIVAVSRAVKQMAVIDAGDGNDIVIGGGGLTAIHGGDGDDMLYGGTDTSLIFGDAGDDTIHGDNASNCLSGGDGNDRITGGPRLDLIFGEAGNDILDGQAGADIIIAGGGNDQLFGGLGNDLLLGESGNDILRGGDGVDILLGGEGVDQLFGEADDDYLFYDLDDLIQHFSNVIQGKSATLDAGTGKANFQLNGSGDQVAEALRFQQQSDTSLADQSVGAFLTNRDEGVEDPFVVWVNNRDARWESQMGGAVDGAYDPYRYGNPYLYGDHTGGLLGKLQAEPDAEQSILQLF